MNSYIFTFFNSILGEESKHYFTLTIFLDTELSSSNTITLSNFIYINNYDSINIYRTRENDVTYYYLTNITNISTFTDNFMDDNLTKKYIFPDNDIIEKYLEEIDPILCTYNKQSSNHKYKYKIYL